MDKLTTTVIKYNDWLYAFDQGMVRCFLVLGSSSALMIDTGAMDMDLPGMIRAITPLPVTLCMTHSDGDHTGAIGRFQEVYAHEAESRLDILEGIKLIKIREGHIFDLGDRQLEVIFTPGHTSGSICLLDRAEKLIFSGDTLSYGPVFMFDPRRDDETYMASLKKLGAMAGSGIFNVIYPCHNSCPIDTSVITQLSACMEGIVSGALTGKEPQGMLPPGAVTQEYSLGNVSIYHI